MNLISEKKYFYGSENLNLKISFSRSNFPKNSRQKWRSRNISIYNPITFLLAQDWGDLRHNHLLLSTLSDHPDLVLRGKFFFYRSRLIFLHLIQKHQLQFKLQKTPGQFGQSCIWKSHLCTSKLNKDKTQHWSSFLRSAWASHAYRGDA